MRLLITILILVSAFSVKAQKSWQRAMQTMEYARVGHIDSNVVITHKVNSKMVTDTGYLFIKWSNRWDTAYYKKDKEAIDKANAVKVKKVKP